MLFFAAIGLVVALLMLATLSYRLGAAMGSAWRARPRKCWTCGAPITFPWDYVTTRRVRWRAHRLCRRCSDRVVDGIYRTFDAIRAEQKQ